MKRLIFNREPEAGLLFHSLPWAAMAAAAVLFFGARAASAQELEQFYYWVAPEIGRGDGRPAPPDQSFVIAVDRGKADQIEAIRNGGGRSGFSGRIAAGSVGHNKDYYAPGQPVWNWHVASVDSIFDFRTTLFAACECPDLVADPSDIAADPEEWVRQNGNRYTPVHYRIMIQVDPSKRDALANVSNRGLTGTGERTLITGLIVTGGEPRNVVVRALGPSLGARGIQQAAGNPRIAVFRGATQIASNADWRSDARASSLSASYPTLTPENEKEAALLLTLLPGAYTLHGLNEDGVESVVLLEAYDVDAGNP